MALIKINYKSARARMYPKDCPLEAVLAVVSGPIRGEIDVGNCYVAGGFIRRWWNNIKQESDLDLFFKSKESYDKVTAFLKPLSVKEPVISEFNEMYEIKVSDTWTLQVQAIKHRFYPSLDDVFDSFDFTLCQFGFDGNHILMTNEALIDSQRKRLVPHKIQFGASSLRRIVKYTQQGYFLCAGAATEFLKQVSANPKTLDTTLISMD